MTEHLNKQYETIWCPQPGGQILLISCPIYEVLFEGPRGGGKTDGLLMDFTQEVGKGYGDAWRGILFRQSYPELEDIIARTLKWFSRIFPDANFNKANHTWTWPSGEALLLRFMDKPDDYWHYHGHEYPWIAWEELTNWATPDCYVAMIACCRSSHPNVPRKLRATTNPYGPGHNWVKHRFIDPAPRGVPFQDPDTDEWRVAIHSALEDNISLLKNDPGYKKRLLSDTNEARRKAWVLGDWDIVAGGVLDGVWDSKVHIIKPFEIPKDWFMNRSFDWGASKPFSVGWWAESNGEDVRMSNGSFKQWPAGTLFRFHEWYGWGGRPNEGVNMIATDIAQGILDIEKQWKDIKVYGGPADSSIFNSEEGPSIADRMARKRVYWTKADKKPGSRIAGLDEIRTRLQNSMERPMEEKGLFVFDNCRQFIRTVPTLPRSEKNPDDADTDAEDHIYDETRYRVMSGGVGMVEVPVW